MDRVLADPQRVLLATDFDGVLAPIVSDPAQAEAHPDAVRVLGRLAGSLAAVVIVTGRPVRDVLRLGVFEGAAGLQRLRIRGQYGIEQWNAGSGDVTAPDPHPGIDDARPAVVELLARLDLADAHIEDKGRALGVHVRRLSDPHRALTQLREPLSALAAEHDLVVEPGKNVLELRAPGMDKGVAVDSLLDDPELSGVHTVIYAGDDLGDLAAFDAIERHRGPDGHAAGAGLLLGVAGNPAEGRNELLDRADLVLSSPDELVSWLDQLADALAAPAPAPGGTQAT
ncbi:trehalose-phosphatase [soil metagenome]